LQTALPQFAGFVSSQQLRLWHRLCWFSRRMNSVNSILGLDSEPQELTFLQVSLRAVIVFISALVMVRLGSLRSVSKRTVFDVILGFVLASMLARAVNGTVAFFPTIGAGFVLIGLHKLMAVIARKSHAFGNLVKGRCIQIIKDGVPDETVMKQHDVSDNDLLEDLRLNGNVASVKEVKAAYLERNGQISVVRRE
jgi:uncharacterized membrane protein YcaP (DUF421 family)